MGEWSGDEDNRNKNRGVVWVWFLGVCLVVWFFFSPQGDTPN